MRRHSVRTPRILFVGGEARSPKYRLGVCRASLFRTALSSFLAAELTGFAIGCFPVAAACRPVDRIDITTCLFESDRDWRDEVRPAAPTREQLEQAFKTLRKGISSERAPSIDLGFGFNGDAARDKSQYTVDASLSLTRGTYPRVMSFETGDNVRFQNRALTEEVTTIKASYKEYLDTWLEAYGFIERFTDAFMQIDQRYEIGPGLKAELTFWRLATGKKIDDDLVTAGESAQIWLNRHPDKVLQPFSDVAAVREAVRDQRVASAKANSILTLSLASTVFSELEQAHIDGYVDTVKVVGSAPSLASATTRFPLPASQRYRVVVRPAIEVRPKDLVDLKALFYIKYPLGAPTRVDGKLDYRTDVDVIATMALKGDEKYKLQVEFLENYDNAPPRLSPETAGSSAAVGVYVRNPVAPSRHQMTRLRIVIGL